MYIFNQIFFDQYVLPYNAPSWGIWLVFALSTLISILVGYLCIRFKKYGLFLLGILFGLIIGLILFSALIYLICNGTHYALLATEILCGAGFGYLTFYLDENGIIYSTSIIGSYLVIRASSWFIGGYPNEWTIYEQLQSRAFNGYWTFYFYLIGFGLVAFGGIIFQSFRRNNNPEDSEGAKKALEEKFDPFHNKDPSQYKNIKTSANDRIDEP